MHIKKKTEPQDFDTISQFDILPNSAFVRLRVVKQLFGLSTSSVYRQMENGSIPRPVKLSERTACWNVGVLRACIAEKLG